MDNWRERDPAAVSIDRNGVDGRGRIKPIEVHAYKTPTAGGVQLWSAGIMYLTEAEGRLIRSFADQLQRRRSSSDNASTIVVAVPVRAAAAVTNDDYVAEKARATEIAREMKREVAEAAREAIEAARSGPTNRTAAKPSLGDRFSGIDLEGDE